MQYVFTQYLNNYKGSKMKNVQIAPYFDKNAKWLIFLAVSASIIYHYYYPQQK